jgi:hypothetical protein
MNLNLSKEYFIVHDISQLVLFKLLFVFAYRHQFGDADSKIFMAGTEAEQTSMNQSFYPLNL